MPSVTTILTTILVAVGGFMTFLIMLQEGKGGGLASLGGTKAAGIEGVTNPIRRATGYMAGLFFFLAIVLAVLNKPAKAPEFITDKDTEKATTVEEGGTNMNMGGGPVGPTKPGEVVKAIPATTTAPSTAVVPTTAPTTTTAPKTDANKADAPKTDAPKTDAPKADAPKATDPVKTDTPKAPVTK